MSEFEGCLGDMNLNFQWCCLGDSDLFLFEQNYRCPSLVCVYFILEDLRILFSWGTFVVGCDLNCGSWVLSCSSAIHFFVRLGLSTGRSIAYGAIVIFFFCGGGLFLVCCLNREWLWLFSYLLVSAFVIRCLVCCWFLLLLVLFYLWHFLYLFSHTKYTLYLCCVSIQ